MRSEGLAQMRQAATCGDCGCLAHFHNPETGACLACSCSEFTSLAQRAAERKQIRDLARAYREAKATETAAWAEYDRATAVVKAHHETPEGAREAVLLPRDHAYAALGPAQRATEAALEALLVGVEGAGACPATPIPASGPGT